MSIPDIKTAILVKRSGRLYRLEVSERGGECGVWVEEDGEVFVEAISNLQTSSQILRMVQRKSNKALVKAIENHQITHINGNELKVVIM